MPQRSSFAASSFTVALPIPVAFFRLPSNQCDSFGCFALRFRIVAIPWGAVRFSSGFFFFLSMGRALELESCVFYAPSLNVFFAP